jgi:hypothetical protein
VGIGNANPLRHDDIAEQAVKQQVAGKSLKQRSWRRSTLANSETLDTLSEPQLGYYSIIGSARRRTPGIIVADARASFASPTSISTMAA